VTISGTITVVLRGYESVVGVNAKFGLELYRLDAEGNYVSTIGSAVASAELGTVSSGTQTFTITPSSTALSSGDRVGIRPYVTNEGTMGAGSVYIYYGGTDSYVSFTETITEYTGPSGTTLYLKNTASDVSGKQAWTTEDGANTDTTTNTSSAPSDPGNQATASAGGTALVWFTKPLSSVTIAGRMAVKWYGAESNVLANTYPWIKIERTNNAGAVQSTVYSGPVYMEHSTTNAAMTWFPLPTSTSISNGDRLKITPYIASNKGFGAQASGYTATVPYGTATGVNVKFTETLSEGEPETPAPISVHFIGSML